MEMTYECPACGRVGQVSNVEAASAATCSGCGQTRELTRAAIDEGGRLRACAWCATEDLYLQKDFPHGLGLAIVVAGFAISTAFWYEYLPVMALATLMATAALDLVLYYVVPDVVICYRCLGQYRGPASNPPGRFVPFDLAIGERYRQERLRIEQLRRDSASSSPPA